MQYDEQEFAEILNIFKTESEDIISDMNSAFLDLEKSPSDKSSLKKLLRLIHSLKGSARMLGFNGIQDLTHKMEDVLSSWKPDGVRINIEYIQLMYDICDFLNDIIDKSVKQKSEYTDDKILFFINELENCLIPLIENPDKEQQNDSAIYFMKMATDINAIILEIMFVLEKDDSDDVNESFNVIIENLNRLSEYFVSSEYSEINKNISEIIDSINKNSLAKEEFIPICKKNIGKLRNKILKLYKGYNISKMTDNILPEGVKSVNPALISEKIISDNIINLYNNLLKNLKSSKKDRKYISQVISMLEEVKTMNNDKYIEQIIIKSVNILKMFINKSQEIDNDSYIVLMQCIRFIRYHIFNKEDININNFNFLIQRLNVVQDMLDITELKGIRITDGKLKQTSSVSLGSGLDTVNQNVNAYELQEIKSMRVDTAKLDALISQINELMINGIKTKEHLSSFNDINDKLMKWNLIGKKIYNYIIYIEKKDFLNSDNPDSNNLFFKKIQNYFINNLDIMLEIQSKFDEIYKIFSEDDNKLYKTVSDIENIAKSIRVLPLAAIFHSFYRMVRDIAKENNKKIDLIVTGSDTEVDKKILEEIKTPLIHIIRNSVSHGIELPQDRIKKGKPETGTIKLSAKIIENNVIISIEDDGYGINLEQVKLKAVQKGLLSKPEIDNMTDEQLMKILFLPGFSTNDSVNEISGRGIGLDVVKTKINNLNGDIYIDSVMDKGCRVSIKIPLSMSKIKTFVFSLNNQKYALPINAVKYVCSINADDIYNQSGQNYILKSQKTLPVYFISEILGENTQLHSSDEKLTVLVVESQDRQAGFIIDKLIGLQEILHKKFMAPIMRIKNISGFSTLSTGEICLIINPYELVRNTVLNSYPPKEDIEHLLPQVRDISDKNIVVFGNDIRYLQSELSDEFRNIIVFNNIDSVYDYIRKNNTDLIICGFDNSNQAYNLLKTIKTDEVLCKIKVIFISDSEYEQNGDIKPDIYIPTIEVDCNYLKKSINQLL